MKKFYTVRNTHTHTYGADCGTNRELLIAKFRLKLKEVGKTTGPFMYGLEKVSFHFNPKERQCQRMLKLPHNCTHLTR